ncbi:MAG: arginyltransferase [Xanthomonadaceae bacterium]|nr:arginyltransferase [Xanthomonadaceae bacterium]
MQQGSTIRLYQTGEHRCGYFVERMARDLLLDPHDANVAHAYPTALASGFRRSGDHVYRPHCPGCRACVAARVTVPAFTASRSQRRCLADNRDLQTRVVPALRSDEHFLLYQRYLAARHAGAGMDNPAPEDFDQFLRSHWCQTRFLELRKDEQLLAVAVTDQLPDALSAVYTFFEPDQAARSLGTLAVLQQILWAQREGLRHLYLGYWIANHPKMDYKARFAPLEILDKGRWVRKT